MNGTAKISFDIECPYCNEFIDSFELGAKQMNKLYNEYQTTGIMSVKCPHPECGKEYKVTEFIIE